MHTTSLYFRVLVPPLVFCICKKLRAENCTSKMSEREERQTFAPLSFCFTFCRKMLARVLSTARREWERQKRDCRCEANNNNRASAKNAATVRAQKKGTHGATYFFVLFAYSRYGERKNSEFPFPDVLRFFSTPRLSTFLAHRSGTHTEAENAKMHFFIDRIVCMCVVCSGSDKRSVLFVRKLSQTT